MSKEVGAGGRLDIFLDSGSEEIFSFTVRAASLQLRFACCLRASSFSLEDYLVMTIP